MKTALLLMLPLALLPTACAHTRHHKAHHGESFIQGEQVVVVEKAAAEAPPAPLPMRRPAEALSRIPRYGKRAKGSSEMIRIQPRDGGWAWKDILKFVSEEAGIAIRYPEANAILKGKKLNFMGPMDVARDDLIAWLQDTAFYSSLVIVPQGPSDRRAYVVMDLADPAATTRPAFVSEDELPALAGRVGLYVSCVLTLPDGVDPSRAINALSQLSTRTAGLGRVSDVGKGSGVIVVNDMAAVVATMRHALDQMAVSLYETSTNK